MSPNDRLGKAFGEGRHLCVSLDPVREFLPEPLQSRAPLYNRLAAYVMSLVEATSKYAAIYTLNPGLFEQMGPSGTDVSGRLVIQIRHQYPDAIVIVDRNYGHYDIAANEASAEYVYGMLEADGVTLNPFVGSEALKPFFRADKLAFVLCCSPNPGAEEFQEYWSATYDQLLYEKIASSFGEDHADGCNLGLVLGPKDVASLASIRNRAPSLPLIILDNNEYTGGVADIVRNGANETGSGFVVGVSCRKLNHEARGEDYAEVAGARAKLLNDEIKNAVQSMAEKRSSVV